MKKNIETEVDLTIRAEKLAYGYTSKTINTPGDVTVDNGMIIYCIKPIGGTATIASASAPNGVPITELAGATILEADEYKKHLSALNFSAIGFAVEVYFQETLDNFSKNVQQ